ncbi:YihY/virulence factor BrkB family protein [Wenxinia marina]|uniref:Putative membrane protein n=1 Tax=Wenxinia marina DSM 24838 TaxID=1123501 RepID=A0A0D0PEC9_9RHOB|nr:YihY/virulence factor BrkB family protein [Wenxinia marina]KIQ69746.1 putative membrane protein [Wenxinia marina DSM 24838]GGL60837.1 ribonuclease [Wenxinia marina]
MSVTDDTREPIPDDPAAHPTDITKQGWWATLKRVFAEIGNDHVSLIAAGCAFYGLLAIFPGIVAALAVAGLVTSPQMLVDQLESLASMLPQGAAEIIMDQATAVAGSREGGLGLAAIFGVLIALYSSSKGIQSLMEGLNVAFETDESRGFVRRYLVQFALTIGLIVGVLLIAAIGALLPAALAILPLGDTTEFWVQIIRWPLMILIVVIGLAILYRFGPDRHVSWRWITPGAALATAIWIAGTVAFTVYVSNFGSYNETFGSLGGVIILLTWMWLSAFIVLLGAEFDSEMERQAKVDPEADGPLDP